MRVLQGNLYRSRTAHHVLAQLCSEKKADVVLISEQHQDGADYVWVRHNSTTYVSVYLTPNDRIDDFQIKLDDLEDALREMLGDLIVAGDLNAKAHEWGRSGRTPEEDVSWRWRRDWSYQYSTQEASRDKCKATPRRNIIRMYRERLSSVIEEGWRSQQSTSSSLSPPAQARLISAATIQLIQKACAVAVPKNGAKRLALRAKRRDHDAAPFAADYQAAKKALKKTIKASQRPCWYFIVTRKLGTNTKGTPQDARTLDHIVQTLFPPQPKREISLDAPGISEVPQFTEEELLRAESSMRNKKAPGPDRLPAEIIKVVAQSHPELLLNMYNTCLRGVIFAASWKKARLVLISKGRGPIGAASSYRPICMLDTAGKLLEKLLRSRLHAVMKAAGYLASLQYGFRSGLFTIHAIQEVVTAAKMMERHNDRTRPLCLMATLDVRNAFNSVRWDLIREALEFRCSEVPTPNH
ncbi:uncharacterized protein LOC118447925 [Vespa mandarinia]|uniref:uncharacterized protein LOC118447925 n=1 Tax=Vespa mandarinia TaxID=7446 RepID=UPI0016173E8A|nr:uncharacterized protein LOC118447925 [Vespa mandarinia]